MNQLKKIHAYTLRNGLNFTKLLINKLLEIPNIPYAHKLLDNTPNPTIFLYNKLIQAYSSDGPHIQCLSLYIQMCRHGCSPNEHTFTFLFVACASLSSLRLGQMLHSDFIKHGCQCDIFALTALVDMYAKMGSVGLARRQFDEMKIRDVPTWNSLIAGYVKSGDMEEALYLFSKMPSRNVISWTSIISGYAQNGQYGDALAMYRQLEKENDVTPNQVTIASVLPACANLGALEAGQKIEVCARENGFIKNMFVCNAVLELYSKCGKLDTAMEVFDEMGKKRNLCSWNTMIMGLAIHGKGNEALSLFNQMLEEGISPDDVTFVGAIMACTHGGGGMVARGWDIFKSMERKFHIAPKLEHYGCMVDLLGRAGNLEEAYDLIQNMPMKPDSVVWGALLGGCSFYYNVELAEKAADFLSELEPWNLGNYVILSNIYARAGRWDGVVRLRKLMKGSQIRKAAGYSFIEGGGQIHKFIVEDKSHPSSNEIYALLDEIIAKCRSYVNGIYVDSDFVIE